MWCASIAGCVHAAKAGGLVGLGGRLGHPQDPEAVFDGQTVAGSVDSLTAEPDPRTILRGGNMLKPTMLCAGLALGSLGFLAFSGCGGSSDTASTSSGAGGSSSSGIGGAVASSSSTS